MEPELSLDALIEEGRWLNGCLDSPPEDAVEDGEHALRGLGSAASGITPLEALNGECQIEDSGEASVSTGRRRERTCLLPSRITGKLQEVKGKFGWIWPDRPVCHPDAGKHEGKIYLSHRDVESEIPGVGAHVSFLLYADGSGLGAMNCRPAAEDEKPGNSAPGVWQVSMPDGMPVANAATPRGLAAAGVAAPRGAVRGPRAAAAAPRCTGTGGGCAGGRGGSRGGDPSVPGDEPRAPREPKGRTIAPPNRAQRAAAALRPASPPRRSEDWRPEGLGPAVRPPAKRPADGREQRVRASEVPLTGCVAIWKGSYGWVEPLEPVSHPLFRGRIFLHVKDMAGPEPPEVGATVAFLLYSDADGLGAERCTLRSGPLPPRPLGGPGGGAPGPGAPPGGPGPREGAGAPSGLDRDMAKRLAAWMDGGEE